MVHLPYQGCFTSLIMANNKQSADLLSLWEKKKRTLAPLKGANVTVAFA